MPAPPDESLPAIVSAMGGLAFVRGTGREARDHRGSAPNNASRPRPLSRELVQIAGQTLEKMDKAAREHGVPGVGGAHDYRTRDTRWRNPANSASVVTRFARGGSFSISARVF